MLGAFLICIDLVVCKIPGRQNFKVERSNAFLSSSLSLSFGVMVSQLADFMRHVNVVFQLFSALYNMLPSAKKSLIRGGLSEKAASWALIGLFLGGAVGIQLLSRVMHHYLPSHVVDCDHSHGEGSELSSCDEDESQPTDDHPDLGQSNKYGSNSTFDARVGLIQKLSQRTSSDPSSSNRPSLGSPTTLPRQWTGLLSTSKQYCDENGQCHGYSDPCSLDCFKNMQERSTGSQRVHRPNPPRILTTPQTAPTANEYTPLIRNLDEESTLYPSKTPSRSPPSLNDRRHHSSDHHSYSGDSHHLDSQSHHHHVPNNAFLSIGLQTSLAIALHKLPEGFITYATNHANPRLGTTIFLSLFIHNITEGFALALPLYLALHSRLQAILWSTLLGGVSQPLGAGVAALWFHIAGQNGMVPGEAVYGGLFSVTAGIMASVALQLFEESMDLTHNRGLCMVFAFIGMGILGISSALTA
jgi:zinc transporter, ZIP family